MFDFASLGAAKITSTPDLLTVCLARLLVACLLTEMLTEMLSECMPFSAKGHIFALQAERMRCLQF
jgi:hypothetical protein